MVQRLHDEHIIEVGSDHLLAHSGCWIQPGKERLPSKCLYNLTVTAGVVVYQHKIACGRESFQPAGVVHASLKPAIYVALLTDKFISFPVYCCNPRWNDTGIFRHCLRQHCRGESIVYQIQCLNLHCWCCSILIYCRSQATHLHQHQLLSVSGKIDLKWDRSERLI